jgi:hypothetical protein
MHLPMSDPAGEPIEQRQKNVLSRSRSLPQTHTPVRHSSPPVWNPHTASYAMPKAISNLA